MQDDFGERMKSYEDTTRLDSEYIAIRLDGKGFSNWTRNANVVKPFDKNLHTVFCETTFFLMKEVNAKIGYTQSDEITLILHRENELSEHYLGGKVQKLCSVLSSICAVNFNYFLNSLEKHNLPPAYFDARVFSIPSGDEAANVILWRVQDCSRNSISQLAQCHFSHKELMHKSCEQMKDLLKQKGIDWEQSSNRAKYGTFFRFTRDGEGRRLGHEVIPETRPNFQYIKGLFI